MRVACIAFAATYPRLLSADRLPGVRLTSAVAEGVELRLGKVDDDWLGLATNHSEPLDVSALLPVAIYGKHHSFHRAPFSSRPPDKELRQDLFFLCINYF